MPLINYKHFRSYYKQRQQNMASNKEWLRKNIEDGNIWLYSFTDFIDPMCIGGGGYGVVFKAKAKTLAKTVAYKLLFSQNEDDEVFENFVKEVSINMTVVDLDIMCT